MSLIASLLLMAAAQEGSLAVNAPREDLAPAEQDKGEMVCRRFNVVGSRLTNKKVCKTKREWEDARNENAEVIRQQRGAIGGPQPGNGGG